MNLRSWLLAFLAISWMMHPHIHYSSVYPNIFGRYSIHHNFGNSLLCTGNFAARIYSNLMNHLWFQSHTCDKFYVCYIMSRFLVRFFKLISFLWRVAGCKPISIFVILEIFRLFVFQMISRELRQIIANRYCSGNRGIYSLNHVHIFST